MGFARGLGDGGGKPPPYARKTSLEKGGRFPLSGGNVERSETKGVGITGPYGYVVHGRCAEVVAPYTTRQNGGCAPTTSPRKGPLLHVSIHLTEISGHFSAQSPQKTQKRPAAAAAGRCCISGERPLLQNGALVGGGHQPGTLWNLPQKSGFLCRRLLGESLGAPSKKQLSDSAP